MTAPPTDCPTDDLLAQYLDDGLSPAALGPLTLHIDGCRGCQTKLDALTAGGGVSDRLKALSSALNQSPEVTLDRGVMTATDTQMFGSDGIPMIPRVQVTRPSVPGYDVDAEIGRGGMGVVFKAQHKRLNRTVALKMVLAAGVADPRVSQRFLFEAEVLARVQHPQVVQVYEVNMFTAPTGVVFPYLAMELLSGGTLNQWVNGRTLAPPEAAELIEGLARAAHAVHQQGIVHRDLKPANILRSAEGVFKVSDFGLAKLTAEPGAQLTGTGMVVGTPAYMAPEQAGGEGVIGPPADVYSLGAILFELLAGRPPFPGDDAMSVLLKVIRDPAPDVRSLRPDVPRDLAAVVMKCLTKEPARRYVSADDLADDLKRFLNHRPTRARTLSTVEKLWYWSRRNPSVATLMATLAVVLTVGLACTFTLWQRAEGTAEEMRRAKGTADVLRKRAEEKSDEAEGERRKADRSRAELLFDRAVGQCESGLADEGLRTFVVALELAERTGMTELARVIRVNVAAWERERFAAGRRFRGASPLRTAAFSGDGKRLATADEDGRVQVWDADTAAEVGQFTTSQPYLQVGERVAKWVVGQPVRLNTNVTGVALDPTGRWAAATLASGWVMVRSPADPKAEVAIRVASPAATPNPTYRVIVWRAAFTSDGRVWVGGDDGVLFAYDPATGKQVAAINLPGIPHPTAQAAVLGGPSFLHAQAGGDLSPDERADRRPGRGRPWQYPTTSVMSLCASADGRRLFAGDRSGRVTEWDPATGQLMATYPFGFGSGAWVYGVAVSADGEYVAATSTDGTARLWRRGLGVRPELWQIELEGAGGSGIALSADGALMAVGDGDRRVTVYDTRGRVRVGQPLRRMGSPVLTVRPGGRELLTLDNGEVRLIPLPDSPCTAVSLAKLGELPVGPVRALDYRPDGGALLIATYHLGVYDPATGQTQVANRQRVKDVRGARFSADGTFIAYGAKNDWGLLDADLSPRSSEAWGSGYITHFVARPAATVGVQVKEGVFVYDTGTGKRVDGPILLPSAAARPFASPDGREWRMAVDDAIEFLDTRTRKKGRAPLPLGGPITRLEQTDDGRHLLALLGEDSAQVWDNETLTRRAVVPVRHRGPVSALALSPDTRVMLSGGRDRTAQFWDAETGLPLGPRRTHPDPVSAAAYSPDGRQVAVGTTGGLTLLWNTPPPPTTATLEELQKRYAGP